MFEGVEMLLGTALGGAGLYLLIEGIGGRRIGLEPHCSKCEYSLMGRVEGQDRCPECGSWLDLRGAVCYGDRHRRPKRAVLGVLVLLLAVAWFVMRLAASFGAFDEMSFKPTWWVFNAMKADESGAVRVLCDRMATGKLSRAKIDQITDWVLAKQGDRQGPWSYEWADCVETAHRYGLIDPSRWERYLRQSFAVQVRIRPVVRPGDPLPVEWRLGLPRLSTAMPSQLTLNLTVKAGELVEKDHVLAPKVPNLWREEDPVFGWATTSANAKLGRQKVVLEWEICAGGSGIPLTKVVQSQTLECDVTDKPTAIGINRPDLEAGVNASLRGDINSKRKTVRINVDSPPMDLAFDVALECSGRHILVGQAVCYKGSKGTWLHENIDFVKELQVEPGELVRMVLRPSAAAAAKTIDLREYWDGNAPSFEKVETKPPDIGQ